MDTSKKFTLFVRFTPNRVRRVSTTSKRPAINRGLRITPKAKGRLTNTRVPSVEPSPSRKASPRLMFYLKVRFTIGISLIGRPKFPATIQDGYL